AGKPKTKQTQQQPHNKKAAEPSSSPHGIKNMTHYRDLKQHTHRNQHPAKRGGVLRKRLTNIIRGDSPSQIQDP
ncbi:hypothetical protein J5X07_04865, partial [Actinomyces bowdenii]|uniref:hypothetical protein n=1 Tax=Actinomyces bowdenii TaxID=131109 RepID=UPI001ABC6938